MNRAWVASASRSACSASLQRPVASSTSAWIVRHEPNSGGAPTAVAKASTWSHHSVARAQSPVSAQPSMSLQ
jgi:hypothetical protein